MDGNEIHRPVSLEYLPATIYADIADFSLAWHESVIHTSYVMMDDWESRQLFVDLGQKMVDVLTRPAFSSVGAKEIAEELIANHFTGVGTIENTLLIIPYLETICQSRSRLSSGEFRERLIKTQAILAASYAQSLQQRTFDEQETIYQAALSAVDKTEKALKASEKKFIAVFEGAAIAIIITDPDGSIIHTNKAFSAMTGYALNELIGLSMDDFLNPMDVMDVSDTFRELLEGKVDRFRVEKSLRRNNGTLMWGELVFSAIRGDKQELNYLAIMVENVTERHRLQNELAYQAWHDPLTSLPNRASFLRHLSHICSHAEVKDRVALCLLDLDGFKAINDSLGHSVGDEVLVIMVQRITKAVAKRCVGISSFVGRMDGDEFVVVLNGSKHLPLQETAEDILADVAKAVYLSGHELTVTASAGLINHYALDSSPGEFISGADVTMHLAKASGKNQYAVYDVKRHDEQKRKYMLSSTMPTALERGEFIIDYQPLVALANGSVSGVEALIRWRHPELGLLTPDQFIPLAEETGIIVPMGRWVLERACFHASRWQNIADSPLFVSVNLAARQFTDPNLVHDVEEILEKTGLPAHRLQLELTESAVMGNQESLSALRQLHSMNVRIAIDDFGTGYSNFTYLRSLPINELKLAGPFMEGLRSNNDSDQIDEEIISTMVKLAHTLGLTVTAEGIETAAQADRLTYLGCDAGQGWFFARSAPADHVDVWLSQSHPFAR